MKKNNLASPWVRLLAAIIDGFVGLVSFLSILLVVSNSNSGYNFLTSIVNGLIWLVFFWPVVYGLFVVCLTSKAGGTLGQLLTGIRVVDEKGQFLSFKMAFFRTYVGTIVSGCLLGVGYLWMFWDKERQGWHDKVSGTYVVSKNKLGWLVGILILALIIFISFVTLGAAVINFGKNEAVYSQLFKTL